MNAGKKRVRTATKRRVVASQSRKAISESQRIEHVKAELRRFEKRYPPSIFHVSVPAGFDAVRTSAQVATLRSQSITVLIEGGRRSKGRLLCSLELGDTLRPDDLSAFQPCELNLSNGKRYFVMVSPKLSVGSARDLLRFVRQKYGALKEEE